jgi:hypothetical protein
MFVIIVGCYKMYIQGNFTVNNFFNESIGLISLIALGPNINKFTSHLHYIYIYVATSFRGL